MISVTFPDGASRAFEPGLSGLDIAKTISPSLAKRTVAMMLNGEMVDAATPIRADARIEFLNRDDPRALTLIRHDAAHVLADAVQAVFPGTQVTIGPVIENGFYYDFYREQPFTPEDFAAIEKKMREIVAADKPIVREEWSRDEALAWFEKHGEAFKVELVQAIPADQKISVYKQGDWLDLCRGPHMPSTGKIGQAFKLMKVAGAYWRGDSTKPMLQRIYATALAKQEDLDLYVKRLEEAERRDHRRLGARNGPVPFPGGRPRHDFLASQGLDAVPGVDFVHAAAPAGGRLYRGQHAAGFGPRAVGDFWPLADLSREHVHHQDGR